MFAKYRDFARNPEKQSEGERRKNPERPRPQFAQYNRGESDLDQIQETEGIRRAAAERKDQCQSQSIEAEQCADQMFGVPSKPTHPRLEQPPVYKLNSILYSNYTHRNRHLNVQRMDVTQRHFARDQALMNPHVPL